MSSDSQNKTDRGSEWEDEEVLELIHIWADERIQQQLDDCIRKLPTLWKDGEEAHWSRIHTNIQQIRKKIKQLKQNYKKIKDNNNKSGNNRIFEYRINWYHE